MNRRALDVVVSLALAAGIAGLTGCGGSAETDFDWIVRGATVIDGTGAPPRVADVAVADGRIAAIGRLEGRTARTEVDGTGQVLAPGFVDLHSHADLVLLADAATRASLLEAKIRQGVTTVIVGNCGLGVAPADESTASVLGALNGWMTPDGVSVPVGGMGAYLDRLESGGVPLNVGTLLAHGPVRIRAAGLVPGPVSTEALAAMRAEVARGLEEGAFGLSVGLIYPPGMFAPTDELIELAREVAARDRLFTAHVRGSSETLLEATRELIAIGRESGARVHHSHLEAVGERFWPRIPEVLALEDEARAGGVRVSHDVFPYSRAATMMSAIFPPWSLDGGVEALLERLADPATRARIADEIAHRQPEWPPWQEGGWPHNLVSAVGWDGIVVASLSPDTRADPSAWVGHALASLAGREGRPPFDVVADLMLVERGRVGQLVDEISGRGTDLDPLIGILRHPAAMIVSDAEDYGRGSPHPAHAGAFARVLRLNRERGLLPLQELVRRMTGEPAATLGLTDRGTLAVGQAADLVLFDPATVTDRATWDEPRRFAEGIRRVWINGTPVVDGGRYLAGRAGHVLRAR